MKRVSLMTMTQFMRLFFKFNLDHDMEDWEKNTRPF